VSEGISIFDVIKGGGYEASLITTFNATLPFYEEVVLRKLVAAGCRHNVVLMDRQQCAVAWESEASRPRLAGYAYTLLPVGVPGAFHPKICLLLGPKKASILIGSHNLTLSGFGYNREITNWMEVAGPKDAEGAAILSAVWRMARQWIELERNNAPESLLESALAIANFVHPLVANAGSMSPTVAIGQSPDGLPLINQLAEKISPDVKRISVIGAFFDHGQVFIKELQTRWPMAEIVVGIDPDTVHLPGNPDTVSTKYVDVRPLWSDKGGYLHAKALYFESDDVAAAAFVSGSANPSRPAWMAMHGNGNVEAVLLRTGADARSAAETTGIRGVFELPALAQDIFASIAQRTAAINDDDEHVSVPLWAGVADSEVGMLRIACRGKSADITSAILLGPNMEQLEEIEKIEVSGNEVLLRPTIELSRVRSCLLTGTEGCIARVMVLHPSILSTSSRSSKQYQIRSALSALGSSEGDISKVIATVERVIFADETTREVDIAVREHRERRAGVDPTAGPASLSISVDDMPKAKKKLRLLKSGDLAYLIDVLLRRLSEGLESQTNETDKAGRTEEEQIGKEDTEPVESDQAPPPPTPLSDRDIAVLVARRARALIGKMVSQLKLAAQDKSRQAGAVIQLIAVMALLRELRHLDKLKRWRSTGQPLVDEKDRRHMLDESLNYLFSSTTHLIDVVDKAAKESTDEATQLRVLLLWLAWDLGEELTDQIGRIWDPNELQAKLCSNAAFLKLLPPIAKDCDARIDLEQSIAHTVRETPEATVRATNWLSRQLKFGDAWASGFRQCDDLRVGGICYVPGKVDEPHVVLELSDDFVGFWDFGRVRKFARNRVFGAMPS